MNYQASVSDFFKTQKWGTNMLLGAVSILIPMIGPIVLNGWTITQLWSRGDDENPSEYPSFDFQYFTKYLMRGLWPFLVQMASSLVITPIIMILMVFIMIVAPAIHNHEAIVVLMITLGIIAYFVLILALNFIMVPLSLAATITQDFGSAFNFRFVRNFLSLVWKELLITTLFFFGMGIVMMIIAVCTCYIGLFVGLPVITFAWQHIQKQLYLLHLSRGGMVLPRSQKLSDLPPRLPQIW